MLDVPSGWKTMPKEAKLALIRTMIETDGCSAREVANAFSTTRSAVIGFCGRNKINFGAAKEDLPAEKPKQARPFRLYQFPGKRPVEPDRRKGVKSSPSEKRVAFLELQTDQCKRPLWGDETGLDITQKFCCGALTGEGESFCPDCAAQLYIECGRANVS